jgi:hypothetical protein
MPIYRHNPLAPIYIGTWAGRPDPASLPPGTTVVINDIGNQGLVVMRVVGATYRLTNPHALFLSETQFVGVNSTSSEQVLVTYPTGVPRSFLQCLRYYAISFLLTKSGTANTATVGVKEGNAGDITDTTVYASNAVLGITSTRTGSGGTIRKYNSATSRTGLFASQINTPIETGSQNTAVHPANLSAALTDTAVFWTLTATLNATGGDIPAVERFLVEGY